MGLPFAFGTLASSGVWLGGWIPVSINISGLSTSYMCRSELLEWLSLHKLHTLLRVDSWPFSCHFYQIWFWTFFFLSICQIQFSGLCKFWSGFGVQRYFICRRTVSRFVEHLFLNARLDTRLASKNFRHVSESWYVFFFFLFFHRYCNPFLIYLLPRYQCLVFSYLALLKDKSWVFFRYAVACILITNTKWQLTFSHLISVMSGKHTGVSLMECCENG